MEGNANNIKEKILSLNDSQHYSGRYIKAFLLREEDKETEEERVILSEKSLPIGSLYEALSDTGRPEEKGLPGTWEYKGSTLFTDIWERVE